MAVVKKKKAGGTGAANLGGAPLSSDLQPNILQQLQQSLQNVQQGFPGAGFGGRYTPPYQNGFGAQPPPYQGGPIATPPWGSGPPPWAPKTGPIMGGMPIWGGPISGGPAPGPIMQPRLGPGMKGLPPGPPQQPQGPQMDWQGLMGKLQGILGPYLSGGGVTGSGSATGAGGGSASGNPMQGVMGTLMNSLMGFMGQFNPQGNPQQTPPYMSFQPPGGGGMVQNPLWQQGQTNPNGPPEFITPKQLQYQQMMQQNPTMLMPA